MKWLIPIALFGLRLTAQANMLPADAAQPTLPPVTVVRPGVMPMVTYEEQAVAAVLMGEAWSEGVSGMTAVAEVIHQRSVEKGRTPLQIISAPRAFSCVNQTTVDRLIHRFSLMPDYQKALQVAQLVCQTPTRLPGLTNAANHYTRTTERPFWARGKQPVAIVGKHAFYRLDHY